MRTKLILLIAAVIFLAIACSGVTETGNPCPSGNCETAQAEPEDKPESVEPASASYYANSQYGVIIDIPSGWTAEEAGDGQSVYFAKESAITSVTFYFDELNTAPSSLSAYLNSTYRGRSFTSYDTTTLNGYTYDDPSAGASGGDLKEYYFLDGKIFVRAVAEIGSGDENSVDDLLEGVTLG